MTHSEFYETLAAKTGDDLDTIVCRPASTG